MSVVNLGEISALRIYQKSVLLGNLESGENEINICEENITSDYLI